MIQRTGPIQSGSTTHVTRRLHMSIISIIGTGSMTAAIGGLAARARHTVEVMSRDAAKARAPAEQVGAGATTGTFGAAPAGDIVILAVPYSAVLDVVKQYGEELAGKILVDITNPVAPDYMSFVTPGDSSGAQEIANAAPADADVVKAFNTQFSHVLAAGPADGHPLDVFIAGDNAEAKAHVSAFVESIGLRPMDTGLLLMARTLEHVCLLSLGLLTHSVKNTNFSIASAFSAERARSTTSHSTHKEHHMHVFVTGGTGHIGSYIIPDLIAAGHEVTGLARSDASAAAVSALGAKVRRGDISDLDGLRAAAAESDGVIHVAHRQDLLPVGGIDAVAAAELQIMLAYGEALVGTGKPLVVSGSQPRRRTRLFPAAMRTRVHYFSIRRVADF
jgi:predicted dinucleotide-binding enzyme